MCVLKTFLALSQEHISPYKTSLDKEQIRKQMIVLKRYFIKNLIVNNFEINKRLNKNIFKRDKNTIFYTNLSQTLRLHSIVGKPSSFTIFLKDTNIIFSSHF